MLLQSTSDKKGGTMRKSKICFFILCILLVIIIVKQSIFLDFSAKEKESETLYVSTTNEISVLDFDRRVFGI